MVEIWAVMRRPAPVPYWSPPIPPPFPDLVVEPAHDATLVSPPRPSAAMIDDLAATARALSRPSASPRPRLYAGYECHVCHKNFGNAKSRDKHVLRMHPDSEPRYQCRYCSRPYTTDSSRHRHEHVEHGPRRFECPLCHRRYYYLSLAHQCLTRSHHRLVADSPAVIVHDDVDDVGGSEIKGQ